MITIKTKLLRENDTDYLEFIFSDEAKRINVNDSNNNTVLKSVFNRITKLAMGGDVTLSDLEVDSSMNSVLLADVFTEYIAELNQEIGKIRAELRTDLNTEGDET